MNGTRELGTGCKIKLGKCEVATIYQAPRNKEHTSTNTHTQQEKGTEALARKVSYHSGNFLCSVCNYSLKKRLRKGTYNKLKGIGGKKQVTKL